VEPKEEEAVMTEAEWLACTDPRPMLQYLRGKASGRKMRLFLVACVRLVWEQLSDPAMRKTVETAERYADGLASFEELQATRDEIYANAHRFVKIARTMCVTFEVFFSLRGLSLCCGFSQIGPDVIARRDSWATGAKLTGQHQPRLLRDIFGNPFRPVTVDSAWLTPTVTSLATAAYEERDLPSGHLDAGRLAVLADALEDAGCDNAELLSHLRGPGVHARGCWALDLILGRS
jgi:hypothetical protein